MQWQSSDASVAGINQFGSATGNGPGQATIIATANGISCATTSTCGAVTVSNPGRITLTLAPGSVPFASVLVTPTNLATGQSEGTFAVPIDEPQSVGPAQFHIEFTAPDGYTVTPTQVDVSIGSGDDAIVPLLFALIDTVPPVLAVPADVIAEATSPSGTAVSFAAPTATDSGSGVQSVGCDRVSGGPFLLGTTTVHCAATDNAGNAATASFTRHGEGHEASDDIRVVEPNRRSDRARGRRRDVQLRRARRRLRPAARVVRSAVGFDVPALHHVRDLLGRRCGWQ